LFFKGTVGTPEHVTRIWTAIKEIPSWRYEVVGDIQVRGVETCSHPRRRDSGDKPA
jgi:hypothetical protein